MLDPLNPVAAALAYRAQGWHPIPLCRPRPAPDGGCWQHGPSCPTPGKRPLLTDWPKARNLPESTIRAWAPSYGACNVGVLLGAGVCVVDVDPRNGGVETYAALVEQGRIPEGALRQETPSGGWHLFFGCAPETRSGKLGPGIDFLAEGKMVVVAPSVHVRTLEHGTCYLWVDEDGVPGLPSVEWRDVAPSAPSSGAAGPAPTAASAPPSEHRRILSALASIPPEERTTWLRVGAAVKSLLGEAGFTLWDAWSRTTTRGNYDGARNRKDWDSLRPGDGTGSTVNEGTLFFLARDHGWDDPVQAHPSHNGHAQARPPTPPPVFPEWVYDASPGALGMMHRWILSSALYPIPLLSFASALSCMSVVCGRVYGTPSRIRTKLYSLGIAPSGTGKDWPRQAVKVALKQAGLDYLLGGEDIASDSGLFSALERYPAQLMLLDEMGDMIHRWQGFHAKPHERGILSLVMKLSNFGDIAGKEYSQVGVAREDRRPRPDLIDPCLTIYGTSTPDLWGGLTERDLSRGLLGRLLVFEAPAERAARQRPAPGAHDPPPELVEELQRVRGVRREARDLGISELLGPGAAPVPAIRIVPATDCYEAAVDAAEAEVADWARRLNLTGVWPLFARMLEQAEKLALIRAACADPINPALRGEDLRWGLDLARYSVLLVARRVQDSVASTATGAASNALLRFVRQAGPEGVTRSEIVRTHRGISRQERDRIMQDLVEAGLVVEFARPADGGRPGKGWRAAQDA